MVLYLPPWAKRDEVVQRMVNKEEVDQILYHGEYDQNKSQTPPLTTVFLTPDISTVKNAQSLQASKRQYKANLQRERKESDAVFSPKQTLPSNTKETNNPQARLPAVSRTDLSGTQDHSVAGAPTQPARRGCSRKASDARIDNTKRKLRIQDSGIKKRPPARKEGSTKAIRSSRIRTRAQGVTKLLALNSCGRATSISPH